MYVCMYVCMYVREYIFTYMCVHVCMYICMHADELKLGLFISLLCVLIHAIHL